MVTDECNYKVYFVFIFYPMYCSLYLVPTWSVFIYPTLFCSCLHSHRTLCATPVSISTDTLSETCSLSSLLIPFYTSCSTSCLPVRENRHVSYLDKSLYCWLSEQNYRLRITGRFQKCMSNEAEKEQACASVLFFGHDLTYKPQENPSKRNVMTE